jgi:RHS repeat-associated protein
MTQSEDLHPTTSYEGLEARSEQQGQELELEEAPRTQIRSSKMDLRGRVLETSEVGPNGPVVTAYTYGPFGQVARIERRKSGQTSDGLTTRIVYDRLGRKTSITDPDTGETVFGYNAFSEVLQDEQPGKRRTVFARDRLGRMYERRDTIGEETVRTTFEWDTAPRGLGRLRQARSPSNVVTTFAYDQLGRLEEQRWTVRGQSYSIKHAYDQHHRMETLSYPAGFSVRHGYSSGTGELVGLIDAADQTSHWELVEQSTTRQVEKTGDKLTRTLAFLPRSGRLGSIDAVDGDGLFWQALEYSYHKNGNLKRRVEVVAKGTPYERREQEAFLYDGLDRVARWYQPGNDGRPSANGFEVKYGYDDLGNLTRRAARPPADLSLEPQVLEFHYEQVRGAGPHAVTKAQWGEYEYDGRGNQVGRPGGELIEYTAFNLPKRITVRKPDTTSEEQASFEYDAFGERVLKQTPTSSTVYIGGLYEQRFDGAPGASTGVHVYYVVNGERTVAQVLQPFGGASPGRREVLYFHPDRMGSANALVMNDRGEEVDRVRLDPFGNRIDRVYFPDLPTGARHLSGNPASGARLGFTGHEQDGEVGLVNMRGRVYDARLGRFLSTDPVIPDPFNAQAFNLYSYVLNNPLRYTDPNGFEPTIDIWLS